MNHEQFEARMRDEIITRLESWLTIFRRGLTPEYETYSEANVTANLETFSRWLLADVTPLNGNY